MRGGLYDNIVIINIRYEREEMRDILGVGERERKIGREGAKNWERKRERQKENQIEEFKTEVGKKREKQGERERKKMEGRRKTKKKRWKKSEDERDGKRGDR